MNKSRLHRLQQAGWKIGTAQQFLDLSAEEVALIEMKLALAQEVKKRRLAHGYTQQALATQLRSSQSRVAKIEAADSTVSIDLLLRTLLTLGATRTELGRLIGRKTTVPAA